MRNETRICLQSICSDVENQNITIIILLYVLCWHLPPTPKSVTSFMNSLLIKRHQKPRKINWINKKRSLSRRSRVLKLRFALTDLVCMTSSDTFFHFFLDQTMERPTHWRCEDRGRYYVCGFECERGWDGDIEWVCESEK